MELAMYAKKATLMTEVNEGRHIFWPKKVSDFTGKKSNNNDV
jgi:hypothetical protein